MDIFKPQIVKEDILVEGVLKPLFSYETNEISPLADTFSIYATAIFILAAIILIYAIFSKLTNTATSGESNEISAPFIIRSLIALMLLIPVSNNFNVGVKGVVWIAGQGVNLANYAYESWDLKTTITNKDLSFVPSYNNQLLTMLRTASSSHLCLISAKENFKKDAFDRQPNFKFTIQKVGSDYKYKWGENSKQNFNYSEACGYLTVLYPEKAPSKLDKLGNKINEVATGDLFNSYGIGEALKDAHLKATRNLIEKDSLLIAQQVRTANPEQVANMIEQSILNYNNTIKQVFDSLPLFNTDLTDKMKEKGFAQLGSWYFKISQINRQLSSAINNLPKVQGAKTANNGKECRWYSAFTSDCQKADFLASLSTKIISEQDVFKDKFENALTHISGNSTNKEISTAIQKEKEEANKESSFLDIFDNLTTLNLTKKLTEKDSENGVSNPLVRIQSIGQDMVTATQALIVTMLGASFFNGSIATIVMPILLGILIPGLLLAFYIPLLPFIIFFGAIIGWIVQLCLAIFALPLWLLTWLLPDDNQNYLGKTGQGFLLLLEIFLRPFFIFVGMFISMLLINISAKLLTEFFVFATESIYSETSGFLYVMFLIATMLIFFIVLKNTIMPILELVTELPNTIFQWLGSNVNKVIGSYGNQIDNKSNQEVSAGLAISGGIVGQAISSISNIKAWKENLKQEEAKNKAKELDVGEVENKIIKKPE